MAVDRAVLGDPYGVVNGPDGRTWSVEARVKDMSPEEIERVRGAAFARMPPPEAVNL